MAISETTKQVVAGYRMQLRTRWETFKRERDEHLASANALQAEMNVLKAQADALTADVPEPTPVTPP